MRQGRVGCRKYRIESMKQKQDSYWYIVCIFTVSCRNLPVVDKRKEKLVRQRLCRTTTDILDQSDIQLYSQCHTTQLLSIW